MPSANPATIGDLNHRSICQVARAEQGKSVCLKMQHNLVFIPTKHKIAECNLAGTSQRLVQKFATQLTQQTTTKRDMQIGCAKISLDREMPGTVTANMRSRNHAGGLFRQETLKHSSIRRTTSA